MLSLTLPVLSLFARCLSPVSLLRLAPPCASPALSLARPHLRLSHCRTTFSNPTPPEYHCPTLISGDPISSSGFTSWIRKVWDMVPLCIFWCLWWERNTRCFEGMERNVLELKGLVLRTLMEWSKAAGVLVFSSVWIF
uniref:Uncharacterized protein n=1 Tax=Fagus sylvatica TaxID=28930 RepID=A0A2N9FVI8_FAGSY